jgi:hypothetical protein
MFKTTDSNADLLYPATFYQQFTGALWTFLASMHEMTFFSAIKLIYVILLFLINVVLILNW